MHFASAVPPKLATIPVMLHRNRAFRDGRAALPHDERAIFCRLTCDLPRTSTQKNATDHQWCALQRFCALAVQYLARCLLCSHHVNVVLREA